MRAERHAFIRHLAQFAQAEHLVAARIREYRARPGHEFVQPAHRANQLVSGAKIQMISIRKENLHAEIFEIFLRLRFHRSRCSHGHECRRINHSMRRGQPAESCAAGIGRQNFESKIHPRKCIRNAPLPSHACRPEANESSSLARHVHIRDGRGFLNIYSNRNVPARPPNLVSDDSTSQALSSVIPI